MVRAMVSMEVIANGNTDGAELTYVARLRDSVGCEGKANVVRHHDWIAQNLDGEASRNVPQEQLRDRELREVKPCLVEAEDALGRCGGRRAKPVHAADPRSINNEREVDKLMGSEAWFVMPRSTGHVAEKGS